MLNHSPIKIHLWYNQTNVFDIVKYLRLLRSLVDNVQIHFYIIIFMYIDYVDDRRKIYLTDCLKL